MKNIQYQNNNNKRVGENHTRTVSVHFILFYVCIWM